MNDVIVAQVAVNRNTSATNRITFTDVIASARAAGLPTAHLITPDVAIVPSATSAAHITEPYILVKVNGGWTCNCPAEGRCWHQARAIELEIAARGQQDQPNPAPTTQPAPPSVPGSKDRYQAAYADVFGVAA